MSSRFFVPGLPVTQGSMRAVTSKSTGQTVVLHQGKGLKAWREAIAAEAKAARVEEAPRDVAMSIELLFALPRPKRPKYPHYPIASKDLDKLIRACLDALTHVAFADDAQVVCIATMKGYGEEPGVWVRCTPMPNEIAAQSA